MKHVARALLALVIAVTGAVAQEASTSEPAIAATRYKLPWSSAERWRITQGRHETNAWDFQPPGSGSHNEEVLAIEAGTARVTCTDAVGQATVSLATAGGTFQYWHLQLSAVSSAGITGGGVSVRQGQVLGRLHPSPPGSNRGCGWSEPAGASHLHLKMPLPVTLDGVTFSTSGPGPGGPYTSTNVRGGTTDPDSDGDGVPDSQDRCPSVLAGPLPDPARRGCALDLDDVAFSPELGSFNGDGRSDIGYLTLKSAGGVDMAAMLSTGTGTTWSGALWDSTGLRLDQVRIAPGDYNGDGLTDIAYLTGIDFGVLTYNGSTVTYRGQWWTNPNINITTLRLIGGGGGQPHRPFSSWSACADRQYRDFAGRAATSSEMNAYSTSLAAGRTSPAAFTTSLMGRASYWAPMAPSARLYWAYFGRRPDYDGLTYWAQRRRTGTSLSLRLNLGRRVRLPS